MFKEVVPIEDAAVRAKIHQTYRMGYLKDVVLPRVLDDSTFATLSSLMLFNNIEVRTLAGPMRGPAAAVLLRRPRWQSRRCISVHRLQMPSHQLSLAAHAVAVR